MGSHAVGAIRQLAENEEEGPCSVTLNWGAQTDAAAARLLRLDPRRLHGVTITNMTTKTLPLRPQRLPSITEISFDGVCPPRDPDDLKPRPCIRQLNRTRQGPL